MEGGPRQRPGSLAGSLARVLGDLAGREAALGRGAATPPRGPGRPREAGRRPLPASSGRRRVAPSWSGVGGASSVEPRLPDPEPGGPDLLCDLGRLFEPQFAHL